MGSENTVGTVAFDLVVLDTAQKQIEDIAKRTKKPAEAAFQKVGQGIQDSLDRALSGTKQIVQKQVVDPLERGQQKFAEDIKKYTPHFEIATDDVDLLQQKLENTYTQLIAVEKQLRKAERGYGASDTAGQKQEYKKEMTALQAKLISLPRKKS